MRKFLTTGLFSAILGIVIGSAPADASLVSRSFLDQALTDYATTTALDLKANQSDFTDLNTQISGSVDVLRDLLIRGSSSYEFVNSIDPEKFPNTISGAFGLLYQYLDVFARSILHGWTDSNGTSYAGFAGLNNGWTDSEKKTYLGVKGLNDKIGDAWPYMLEMSPGLNQLSSGSIPPEITLENASDLVRFLFGGEIESGISQGGVLNLLGESVVRTGAYDINTGQIDDGFRSLSQLTNGWTDSKKKTYLGVKGLNEKIGTLPSGKFPLFPGHVEFFSWLKQPLTYPTSLAELITAIYGNSETGGPGVLAGIFAGFPIDTDGDGQIDSNAGTISNFVLARDANNLATENATKIGTLPEGEIAPSTGFDSFLRMYSAITNTPISYPTSVAEFVELLLGNSSNPGLLGLMSGGVSSIDSNSGTPIGIHANYSRINNMSEKIGTLPDGYETVGAALTAMDAKIGTLPDGYDSVGAALTAIKGIAEDAKAAALAAIPDPKQEGSTGKYVLTVDIVGDNATYRWEKIDREGETTTTTE